MTALTLSEGQCAWARRLLFRELRETAEALAAVADAATGHDAYEPNLAGDDAHTTWRDLQTTAELLDLIGWSVLPEPARQEGGE